MSPIQHTHIKAIVLGEWDFIGNVDGIISLSEFHGSVEL